MANLCPDWRELGAVCLLAKSILQGTRSRASVVPGVGQEPEAEANGRAFEHAWEGNSLTLGVLDKNEAWSEEILSSVNEELPMCGMQLKSGTYQNR
jgi:hypothetical protein